MVVSAALVVTGARSRDGSLAFFIRAADSAGPLENFPLAGSSPALEFFRHSVLSPSLVT